MGNWKMFTIDDGLIAYILFQKDCCPLFPVENIWYNT